MCILIVVLNFSETQGSSPKLCWFCGYLVTLLFNCIHFVKLLIVEKEPKKRLWKNFDYHLSKTPTTSSSQMPKIIQVPPKKKKTIWTPKCQIKLQHKVSLIGITLKFSKLQNKKHNY